MPLVDLTREVVGVTQRFKREKAEFFHLDACDHLALDYCSTAVCDSIRIFNLFKDLCLRGGPDVGWDKIERGCRLVFWRQRYRCRKPAWNQFTIEFSEPPRSFNVSRVFTPLASAGWPLDHFQISPAALIPHWLQLSPAGGHQVTLVAAAAR